MSDVAIKGIPVNTLYQVIKKSTPAEFAKDKPVIAAVGTAGTAVIVGQTMSTSKIAMEIGKKGLIPAVAAGVAITGAAIIHDSIVNNTPVSDDKSTPENEHVEHVIEKTIKTTAGTAMLLGGTEVIGHAYDINALKPLTNIFTGKVAERVVLPGIAVGLAASGVALINKSINGENPADLFSDNPDENAQALMNGVGVVAGSALIGAGTQVMVSTLGSNELTKLALSPTSALAATGTAIAIAAAKNIKEKGVGVTNSTALTGGSLIVTEMLSSSIPVLLKKNDLDIKANSIVGGAGLGLMAYGLAKTAKKYFSEGHQNIAALSAVGSATVAVASIHVLGNATGVKALSNLAPRVFGENPLLAGAIVATGLTVGSYVIYSKSKEAEQKAKN